MPYGFQFHQGGWFGVPPSDDLLEGWWAEYNPAHGITYVRQGRVDYEEYSFHLVILATCESIPPPHELSVVSYPVAHGRWHGEEDRLRLLEQVIHLNPNLAQWAYRATGRELEALRTNKGYTPVWLYVEGDKRPQYRRMRAMGMPHVTILGGRFPGRWGTTCQSRS